MSERVDPAPERRDRSWLGVALAVAALVRVAHWAAVRTAAFVGQPALDSAEYARWAHAIAAGSWLGGAPFFQAPLYPYLLALVFRAGGGLDTVYLLQIACAVAALALLAVAADRLLGPPHGAVAAALGALYLPAVFHDVLLVKESLATSLVAVVLWALVRARERRSELAWLGVGALIGLLALLRENTLLVAFFLVPLVFARGDRRGTARRFAALVLGMALPLAPVALRNAALGGGFLPTTSQGGVNFWIGNNPHADGTYRPLVPGKQIPAYERSEARRLAEQAVGHPLDGAAVSRYWLSRALGWAESDPLAFGRLQLHKLRLYFSPYEWPDAVDYYWMKTISRPLALPGLEWGALVPLAALGLLLARRRWRELAPVLLFELGWLLSTVAFFLFARYRLPAAPGLWILAAVPFVALGRAWRRGAWGAAAVGALGVALLWAWPHLAGFAPRWDLVDFNRGRLAQEHGETKLARIYYQQALRAAPRAFLPRLDLGTIAARERDYATAARWFAEAVELQPDSDDAHADLGAALLASGNLSAASSEARARPGAQPSQHGGVAEPGGAGSQARRPARGAGRPRAGAGAGPERRHGPPAAGSFARWPTALRRRLQSAG